MGKNGPYFFDLGKSIAPLELLKIINTFRGISPGEFLRIIGCDIDTQNKISKRLSSFKYDVVKLENKKGLYSMTLMKSKRSTGKGEKQGISWLYDWKRCLVSSGKMNQHCSLTLHCCKNFQQKAFACSASRDFNRSRVTGAGVMGIPIQSQ